MRNEHEENTNWGKMNNDVSMRIKDKTNKSWMKATAKIECILYSVRGIFVLGRLKPSNNNRE
jgi:hypothetical protein